MSYDFHTHVLHGIDDGSNSIEQSVSMLEMLKAEGVEAVIATPHFYLNHTSVNRFLYKRDRAYRELMSKIDGMDMPVIYKGAEVMLTTELADLPNLQALCIENTNHILIELPYTYWSNWVYQSLHRIVSERNLQPIIAHIDRYFSYRKKADDDKITKLLSTESLIQINANSLIDWKTRHRALQLIDADVVQFLGSDCHDDKLRIPKIAKARKIIEKRCGPHRLAELDNNAMEVLNL